MHATDCPVHCSGMQSIRGQQRPHTCSSKVSKCRSQRSLGGRRTSHVVAANAPQEGGAPVSREDLIEHLRSGCKPQDKWRIGTEHEKLGFNLQDNTRYVSYSCSRCHRKLSSSHMGPSLSHHLHLAVAQQGLVSHVPIDSLQLGSRAHAHTAARLYSCAGTALAMLISIHLQQFCKALR